MPKRARPLLRPSPLTGSPASGADGTPHLEKGTFRKVKAPALHWTTEPGSERGGGEVGGAGPLRMYFQHLSRDSDATLSVGTMRLRATLLKPTCPRMGHLAACPWSKQPLEGDGF